jgi:trimeric autotransporter adhesin
MTGVIKHPEINTHRTIVDFMSEAAQHTQPGRPSYRKLFRRRLRRIRHIWTVWKWAVLLLAVSCGGDGDPHVTPPDAAVDSAADATPDAAPKPFGYTYVKPSAPETYMGFGRGVAISADGSTIAVGAAKAPGGEINSGAVFIYRRSGATWIEQSVVTAAHPGPYDSFGASVALSADGNTLAIGAYLEDSASIGIDGDDQNDSATDTGAVYVFQFSGTWQQQAYVKAASTTGYNVYVPDNFGLSVALSADGNTLAVGCIGDDSSAAGINNSATDNSLHDAGSAFVFVRNGTTWTQQAYLKAAYPDEADHFGARVALAADGNTLVVAAIDEQSSSAGVDGDQTNDSLNGSGAAFVFSRSATTWTQAAFLKASNPYYSDHFGIGVAISADGSTIAIGADGESSSATGIDGAQNNRDRSSSGAGYVFVRAGATWQQQAYVKPTHPTVGDQMGRTLALSSTGDQLVIASRHGPGRGIDPADTMTLVGGSGAVDWYARTTTTWAPLHYIKSNFPDTDDGFGEGLSISGDGKTVGIGAWGEDSSATGIGGDQQNDIGFGRGALFILE